MSPLHCFVIVIYISVVNSYNTFKSKNVTNEAIRFDDPHRPTLAYPTSLAFLFIFTTILIGVLIRTIMLWTNMCIPYRVVMFSLGGIAGFCANVYPSFKPIVQICYIDVDLMLLIFLPIIVFYTSYSVDSHSFWKCFPQILLVGVPGALMTALMAAFMAYNLIEPSWNFPTAFLFGVICSPIYPMEVVKQLKEMSKGKYIGVLLLGEGLIGDATAMIEFTAVFGYLALALTEASQISLLLLRFAGGGVLLGLVMGEITATLLSITYYDLLCVVTVTLAGAYLTFYIGEKYFYVSGLLGTVIAGVMVSKRKSTVSGDVEHIVSHFWNILSHLANTLVFTMSWYICTTIKHPYQIQMSRDEDSEDDTYMGYRYTTCPDCEREIPNEPTKKEFAEMMREANQRVLKALKISYWRQYEHGKISKDGVRTLVQAVEIAADADDGRINLEQLGTLWKPKAHAVWLRHKLVDMMMPEQASAQIPRHQWRQWCYRLVSNIWFDGFIYMMILCNTPVILCEVMLKAPVSSGIVYAIKALNLLFYIIYVIEMIVKMLALTVRGYFKSHWNKLDFFIILMATADLILDIIDAVTAWDKWNNSNSSVLTATKLLRMLRFIRLCKLARVSIPKVMAYIDRMIDIQLAFGYDVGKGFVTGEQEVCNLLPQLVDNKQIQETLYNRLEGDRLTVTRQLGLLQRDRPWTAITVKTRQATTSTLNIILLDAMQLKEEGFLDEVEYRLLVNAIEDKVQLCRHKGSLVAPSSPETQLRAVSWLQGNERVADFFIENSEIHNYNFNDILVSRGDQPRGLYILVSGLCEASYIPPEGDMDESLPNYEFRTDLKFAEPSKDYIVSGNAIGVLGVLTNRPYSYTVRCDSAVQSYYITMPIVKEAFNLAPHPIMGLEAAMWREIGIKLSVMILPTVPAYHGWSIEKISMRLENAFVPCLKAFKIFIVNELMEDIILLDGICQDTATREVFQPPCYIPRTVHRLIFPKSSQMVVSGSCPETKLLIVPAKDTDELDIMEDEIDDLQCELVSSVSSRCLYHRAARKLSAESRGKSAVRLRAKRRRAPRRVNYRDSVWGNKISSATVTVPSMAGAQSEKEISSKYYKPSFVDMPEKLESTKPKSEVKPPYSLGSPRPSQSSSMPVQLSEHEIYNTMLNKNKKRNSDVTSK
nr:sodium/hydrogen exchanger 10-like [Vanessa tameamea]